MSIRALATRSSHGHLQELHIGECIVFDSCLQARSPEQMLRIKADAAHVCTVLHGI